MIRAATSTRLFVRRTTLHEGEYRTNFRQVDRDAIQVVTSDEACRVTNLMSKIYFRLIDAPGQFIEREGVLRFTGEDREEKWVTAWEQLTAMLGVASATAQKALHWLHEKGVIGYDAHRNGVGIRIFINRATASIGNTQAAARPKILRFSHTSLSGAHTSQGDTRFNDTYGDLEDLDTDLNRRAPQNGAETNRVDKTSSAPANASPQNLPLITKQKGNVSRFTQTAAPGTDSIDEIVRRLKCELEPALHTAAAQAARLEHERTRDWLDKHGIPKATRVAHKEAYNVLRSHGVINTSAERTRSGLEVGPRHETPKAVPLPPEGIKEMAEMCMAMLETHGQAIDVTLSQVSIEAGGYLLAEDAPRVRELALSMAGVTS